jgi:hypothetical protein
MSRFGMTAVAIVAALGMAAPAVAQAPEGYTMTSFDPARHSFRFANSWSTGNLSVDLPLVGRVDFGSVAYGLCGGMSFAALDTFHAKRVIPASQTSTPPASSAMRQYIWDRQIDSLTLDGAEALRTFLDWQGKGLDDTYFLGARVGLGLRSLTYREFIDKVKPRLDRGEPVPLGVVNVHGLAAPWGNHQVLAIGYRRRPDNHVSYAVYDPNYPISARNPDGITFLHTSNRRQTLDPAPTSARAHTGLFRGVFRAPYARKTPPTPPWQQPASPQRPSRTLPRT